MTGIEEADTDKIVSLVDEDCVADNDVETLSSSFELLTSMGLSILLITRSHQQRRQTEQLSRICAKVCMVIRL